MHTLPLPVIVEHAIISRGRLEGSQDELIGFAYSEREAAILAKAATIEGVGMVRVAPTEAATELAEADLMRAQQASAYWFVSKRDEEIAIAFGSVPLAVTPVSSKQLADLRRKRDLRIVASASAA